MVYTNKTDNFICSMHSIFKKGTFLSLTMDCKSENFGEYYFLLGTEHEYFPTIYILYNQKGKKQEIKIYIHTIGVILKQFLDNLSYFRHLEIAYENFPESDKLYQEYRTVITCDLLDNKDISIEQIEEGKYFPSKPIPIIGVKTFKDIIQTEIKSYNKIDINKEVLKDLRIFLAEVNKIIK